MHKFICSMEYLCFSDDASCHISKQECHTTIICSVTVLPIYRHCKGSPRRVCFHPHYCTLAHDNFAPSRYWKAPAEQPNVEHKPRAVLPSLKVRARFDMRISQHHQLPETRDSIYREWTVIRLKQDGIMRLHRCHRKPAGKTQNNSCLQFTFQLRLWSRTLTGYISFLYK